MSSESLAPAGRVMLARAYKTELDPTVEQERELSRHVAGARVAYNWTLAGWKIHDGSRALARAMRALAGHDTKGGEAACMLGYAMAALSRGEVIAVRRRSGSAEGESFFRYGPAPGVAIPDFSSGSIDWNSRIVHLKKEQPEAFGWLGELSAFVVREAVKDVRDGWKHFFEHLKAGRYERAGQPRFRNARDRHYHADQPDPIRVTARAILIPGVGWVRLKERDYFPVTHEKSHRFVQGGKAIGVGVNNRDGRWFVALRAEVPSPMARKRAPGKHLREHPVPRVPGRRIGVEVGVRVLGTTYDGESREMIAEDGLRDDRRIHALTHRRNLWERRMARRQRCRNCGSAQSCKRCLVVQREQSAGWHEAVARVAHYHRRIADLRDDRAGKIVRKIVDTGAETAVLRAPSIAAMLDRRLASDVRKRNALAPDVHGARMGDVRARLEYKMKWAGGKVELVDRLGPTTKRCSECGLVQDAEVRYPDFVCAGCGHKEDRDDNSPKNLYGLSGFDPGEAGPRDAGSKPPNGDNDRRKRTARAKKGKPSGATAPHGGETDALGLGNRDVPGVVHSMHPNPVLHDVASESERSGDDESLTKQSRGLTAGLGADEPNRSQTGRKRRGSKGSRRSPSEATS